MRVITISIDVDNAAFQTAEGDIDNGAVATEVGDVARRIGVGAYSGRIVDVNGNTVGRYSTEDK